MDYTAILAILLCVGVSATSAQNLTCPGGYIQGGLSCYKFYKEQMSWPEALTFCRAYDSHLVTLETPEEQLFIKTKVKEMSSFFALDGIWVDMSDAVNQGEWVWTETNVRLSYNAWGPGEPEERPGEDCAGLYRKKDYDFADYYCGRDRNHIICEKEPEFDTSIIG